MEPPISPLLFCSLLFVGMLVVIETGRRSGIRRVPQESKAERRGLGTIEGAVFALLALLVAFSFSGAASRFNEKRMRIAEEANAIARAYLRLELLPPQAQSELQDLFRRYVDSRLEIYRRLSNWEAAAAAMAESRRIREEIWAKALDATRLPDSHPEAGKLLLPALNSIDITTSRTMAPQIHPPRVIYGLLFGLGLIGSLLAGYRMAIDRSRSRLHILGFAVIMVTIVYVMLEVEYPQTGLIRLEAADQLLVDVRSDMK